MVCSKYKHRKLNDELWNIIPWGEAEDLRWKAHEVTKSIQGRGVINQGGESQGCQNEKVFDSNYENAQEVGVSNIACQEETSESIDIALSNEKLDYVEKLENIQASIHEENLSRDEEALHIISQLAESPSLQEDIRDSSTDIQKEAPLAEEKNL